MTSTLTQYTLIPEKEDYFYTALENRDTMYYRRCAVLKVSLECITVMTTNYLNYFCIVYTYLVTVHICR